MFRPRLYVLLVLSFSFFSCFCQEYDFAAEMTRQCLVPDPVGLVDCVEEKVTLPYLVSWVECTNSLGQNVKTSADIVNYRCKSVWEGKGLMPEVFYLKDCVIEKTGLPAKNVSAEVLGAYKECESSPAPQPQRIKTAPIQQQRVSTVEYQSPIQQSQAPVAQPPTQQFQVKVPQPPTQQIQVQIPQPPNQQFQVQVPQPPVQQFQAPVQQFQPPVLRPPTQQFQAPVPRPPTQQYQVPITQPMQQHKQVQHPVQQVLVSPPIQQAPPKPFMPIQQTSRQLVQNQVPVFLNQPVVSKMNYQVQNSGAQYMHMSPKPANPTSQPYSQQYFVIYPQAPLLNQQQRVNNPILSQKTVQTFVPQQQIAAPTQVLSTNPNVPYSYSFQINHPLKVAL